MRFGKIDRSIGFGAVAFLLILAVLGVRSRLAADQVLASHDTSAPPIVARSDDPHGLRGLARRDSLVRNAVAERGNPFHSPKIVQEVARPTFNPNETPAPVKRPEPRLLTLLHDDVNPCVQISIGDDRSGWLHRGDSFQGWNVDDIARESVTLAKKGRKVVLR